MLEFTGHQLQLQRDLSYNKVECEEEPASGPDVCKNVQMYLGALVSTIMYPCTDHKHKNINFTRLWHS